MKKSLIDLSVIILFFVLAFSCKKSGTRAAGLSTLRVVNLNAYFPNESIRFAYHTGQPYPLIEDSITSFSVKAGLTRFSIVSSYDTSGVALEDSVELAPDSAYALYLFGDLTHLSSLCENDIIPTHADTVCGGRFLNLSPDAGPIVVNTEGLNDDAFYYIHYKEITLFRSFPTLMPNSVGYTFDVDDSVFYPVHVLAKFNWHPAPASNSTFVLTGALSDRTLQVVQLNN
jgi:hypothetical protein